jgi:heat shock protein HtpX
MKRIVLFVLTKLAAMVVLSIVLKVFGIDRAMAQEGFNLGPLLVFSAVFGFGGAIISLLISKPVAKWSTGAQIISYALRN